MKARRLLIVALALALLGALFAFGLLRGSPDRNVTSNLLGKPAPDFTLPLYERYQPEYGAALQRSAFDGKPLVINFWASWCLPCFDEAPVLQAAWQAYEGMGVQFIGIQTQDPGRRDEGRAFISQFGLTFPNVVDDDSSVSVDFGLFGVPETFFVDASGRVAYRHVGPVTPQVMEAQLQTLLGGAGAGAPVRGAPSAAPASPTTQAGALPR